MNCCVIKQFYGKIRLQDIFKRDVLPIKPPIITDTMFTIILKLANQSFMDKYYLAGGTALALQINHRRSIDLDFFSYKKISAETITSWLEQNYRDKEFKIVFRKTDQLDINIMGVKVSFIHYPFTLVNPLLEGANITPSLPGLKIANVKEIALMKAYVLGRRTSFRDYIDLYYILKNKYATLGDIIKECQKKYVLDKEQVFSGKLFLQQLAYTEDITDKSDALSFLDDKSLTVETIETFLRKHANDYMLSLNNNEPKGCEEQ